MQNGKNQYKVNGKSYHWLIIIIIIIIIILFYVFLSNIWKGELQRGLFLLLS
jgi:cytochrome b561